MENRYIFRMIVWGLLFVVCIILGVYGLVSNYRSNSNALSPLNNSIIVENNY